ncbi:hypothetical protein [Kribbella speibonae]|uniref:Uncharacterized protein n=1 Tax=Kribbella speibonae TaxID=1572660 RepID=A0A4R0J328_9ACTN|nr:hypothetical protein [Kribbella speibonae]TCC40289.1 hypothetical protein E0H92_00810 [Kribbella speibonae]
MAGRLMRRQVRRPLDRHSPWRRGYDEGFDCGVSMAVTQVDDLLSERFGSTIARSEVQELATQLRRELS